MIRNLFTRAITVTALSLLPGAAVAQPMLPGAFQVINDGAGIQMDPHIDCKLASYTDEQGDTQKVRYFDFATGTDALVPWHGDQFLSDPSGNRIAFTNVSLPGSEIRIFDVASSTVFTIPGGAERANPSLGVALVAFEDRSFSTNPNESEIVVYHEAMGISTRLTSDALMDRDPVVTPAGNAVVFEKCALTGGDCDIYLAAQTSPGVFVTTPLTGPAGNERNVDTNGIIAVYQSTVGGETDIEYVPLSEGTATRLNITGEQRNPAISGHLLTFESEVDGQFDLFAFDLLSNTLYQVTNTSTSNETLNDISLCGGVGRIVYAAPDSTGDFDLFAFIFAPPAAVGAPAALTLTPTTSENPVGSVHTLTATVTDRAGQPVPDVTVRVRVQGAVFADLSCITRADGQCSVTYSGPLLPGADLIAGFADTSRNGAPDENEPTATATKLWVLPAGTTGHAMGGGQIAHSARSDEIAFVFHARGTDRGFKGTCHVIDRAADVRVECLDVLALVINGNHATVFGRATINGVDTAYRIDAEDYGDPGGGHDRFAIQTSSGYSAVGVLIKGNVQVR